MPEAMLDEAGQDMLALTLKKRLRRRHSRRTRRRHERVKPLSPGSARQPGQSGSRPETSQAAPERQLPMSARRTRRCTICRLQQHDAARRRGARARRSSLPARRAVHYDAVPAGARRVRRAPRTGDVVVACTQEAARCSAKCAEEGGRAQAIRFVNIRETGGWSAEARAATPKIAALLASRRCPSPSRCRASPIKSDGRCCHRPGRRSAATGRSALADAARGHACCSRRARAASCRASATTPSTRARHQRSPAGSARSTSTWAQDNPIDLDLCTRCNACIEACPEQAIDFELPDRPRQLQGASRLRRGLRRRRRDRLRAQRRARERALRPRARPARDAADRACTSRRRAISRRAPIRSRRRSPRRSCASMRRRVREAEVLPVQGEDLRAQPLATARLQRRASTSARRARASAPDGDRVEVEPHLCVGCGACTTVCPSRRAELCVSAGARPRAARIRTLLADLRDGGRRATRALLLHAEEGRAADRARCARRGARAAGARHPARGAAHRSVGIDLWLAAIAYGASQVAVLATDEEAPQYRDALATQMAVAEAIAQALGYQGEHFRIFEARDALRSTLALRPRRAGGRAPTATFRAHARQAHDARARDRPSGCARAGAARGDRAARRRAFGAHRRRPATRARCAWPASAPARKAALARQPRDAAAALHREELRAVRPLRRHLPRARDHARAAARLRRRARKQPRVLNEAAVRCIRCGKPFGTQKMIDDDARQARRRTRCSQGPARSTGCRCAPTAASST